MDTEGIVKTSEFHQQMEDILEKPFSVWQRKLQNYAMSVFSNRMEPGEWAVIQGTHL